MRLTYREALTLKSLLITTREELDRLPHNFDMASLRREAIISELSYAVKMLDDAMDSYAFGKSIEELPF